MASREDRLNRVLWPFYILAIIPAILCARAVQPEGWQWAAPLIGFFILWSVGLLLLYIIAVFLLSLTVDKTKPVPENHPFFRRIGLSIVGLLCRFGRLRIHGEGWEKMPEGRFLLVSNHISNYDPIVMLWLLRKLDLAFVTKPENLRIPLAGGMIHMMNFLPIDRENPRHALEAIQGASDLLERDVVTMGIYPEGTRSKDCVLLPFHDAVFKIAKRAKVPILVASTEGTNHIHEKFPLHHTDVTLTLLEVMDTDTVTSMSTKDIGVHVRALMEEKLGQTASSES
ncbi:MAG: 1-acyl-sn-glycerol-3-phosphate acyltransferase [Oscillospiraceae bacterium]|nr:1-acyl-sn-glycerol-3-phosphate acyltransferase [Oscillospiraceae bacterium]